MDRAFEGGEGGFLYCFRERGMCVAGASEVVGRAGEFHDRGAFGDDGGCLGAEDVDAEDAVGLGVGDDLREAVGFIHGEGAAVDAEVEFAGVVGNTFGFELLFGFADPCELGGRVDDGRGMTL